MPVVYQVVGFGRSDGRHLGRHGRSVCSVISEGCMHACQKINSNFGRSAVPGNYGHKEPTSLHNAPSCVRIVRQNGRRKSNLDAFVSAQERSNGAH